jgi:hypothetical protein
VVLKRIIIKMIVVNIKFITYKHTYIYHRRGVYNNAEFVDGDFDVDGGWMLEPVARDSPKRVAAFSTADFGYLLL